MSGRSLWTFFPYSAEIFNTGALYILDGIDEANTVTTTTTTS